MRTFIRVILIRNSGWDDYTILGALLFNVGYLAEIIVGKHNHIGFPMGTLSPENMDALMKVNRKKHFVCSVPTTEDAADAWETRSLSQSKRHTTR